MGNTWTSNIGPGGAIQFVALNGTLDYPNPFNSSFRLPSMLVSDLALREDPSYNTITTAWVKDFPAFTTAFAQAWFKLTHRDMGPRARYLGPEVPEQTFSWQDPLPAANTTTLITTEDQTELKKQILGSYGLTVSELVSVAWGSASTFRSGDKRGGANGARIALEPQVSWDVNNPKQLQKVLEALKTIQTDFNGKNPGKQVSLADLIVLGGNAAIESASTAAVSVSFTAGRVDATQQDTDITSFQNLNPQGDGFRNYRNTSGWSIARTEELLVDKAQQLSLTAPEMTVLVGGLRALDANFDGSNKGVLTNTPGKLTNEFFINLLDINTVWSADTTGEVYTGKDRATGAEKWTATRVDLAFGSHAELRAISEVYAEAGGQEILVENFAAAWAKVMDLDRFDVKK